MDVSFLFFMKGLGFSLVGNTYWKYKVLIAKLFTAALFSLP